MHSTTHAVDPKQVAREARKQRRDTGKNTTLAAAFEAWAKREHKG